MTQLATQKNALPTKLDDTVRFVLINTERLRAMQAELRAMKQVDVANEAYKQALEQTQVMAETVLDAAVRVGQMTMQLPTAKGRRDDLQPLLSGEKKLYSDIPDPWDMAEEAEEEALHPRQKTKEEITKEQGLSTPQVYRFEALAKNIDIVETVKLEAKEHDKIATQADVLKKIKNKEKKEEVAEAEKAVQEEVEEEFKPVLTVGDSIGFVPEEKYDLLLTDPPYSTDVDNIEEFVESWLYNALDNIKPTGFAYVFIGAYPEELKAYLNAKIPEHMELCQQLIWTYKNTLGNNPNDRYKQNYQVCLFYRGTDAPDLNCPMTSEQWAVQEINAPDGRQGDRYHAWQKPMEIAERFIRHSTEQGMTVFDPFACTGTFLLAAAKLGRKAHGFEINPENAKIAIERGCINE